MTDQGYSVFWDIADDITGKSIVKHHYFPTESGAKAFAATIPNARIFEREHTPETHRKTIGRDETDALNRSSLVELMLTHNITIPSKQFDNWRPTTPTSGRIEGIADGLTCIMTDGLLGYFLRSDGREPLYGHVAHFMWDHAVTSMVPYYNEAGELRYFQSVKDQGAPSALHHLPPDPTRISTKKPTRKRGEKSKRQQLIDSM